LRRWRGDPQADEYLMATGATSLHLDRRVLTFTPRPVLNMLSPQVCALGFRVWDPKGHSPEEGAY